MNSNQDIISIDIPSIKQKKNHEIEKPEITSELKKVRKKKLD